MGGSHGKPRPRCVLLRGRLAARTGLLGAGSEARVIRVADLDQREPARGHHLECAGALAFLPDADQPPPLKLPLPDRHRSADQGTHHRVAERICPQPRHKHPGGVTLPGELLQVADGGGSLARPAIGGPVVQAEKFASRGGHCRHIERGGVPDRVGPQQRISLGRGIRDAVLVAAPDRREPRVEALRRDRRAGDIHIALQAGDAVESPGKGWAARRFRRRGQGVGGVAGGRLLRAAAPVGLREKRELGRREIEVRDLAGGVHTGIRSSRDGEKWRLTLAAEDRGQRRLELALHRAKAGLLRPALKPGAVVGEIQSQARGATLGGLRVLDHCAIVGPMELPEGFPVAPQLAKAVDAVPEGSGLSYEPKWDGFRAIAYVDGDDVTLDSRGAKPLTRYFPELVAEFSRQLSVQAVLDGEIVVRQGVAGGERLDWEALSQRIHPAESRVAKLAAETPAAFVAFDLLYLDGRSLLAEPFETRRAALELLFETLQAPLHVSQATRDAMLARRWLAEFEGAGLDGVVSKRLDLPYAPNKRVMFKTKHKRTADVVALGYRIHKSGSGVGSLLVGLYDADGELRNVGGVSAFTDARRKSLAEELEPLVLRDDSGDAVTGETDRSRFSADRDVSYVRLRPERVLEVRYDQMEGSRFRHTVQLERWRPDRDARSCTYDQLERPVAYDLGEVLG